MKKRLHPSNIADAEERARHPRSMFKRMKGKAEEIEAQAKEQFAEECRLYVPGVAFSDVPAHIIVPCKDLKGKPAPDQTIYLRDIWRDMERWKDVRSYILDRVTYRELKPLVPKGWNFDKLAKDARPHPFDLVNPRHYTLTGNMVPWGMEPGAYARRYVSPEGHFDKALLDLFTATPPNLQAAEVSAFLDHHRTKGGNAEAFMDHVVDMLKRWQEAPPAPVDRRKLERVPIARFEILTRTMEQWLKEVRMVPTSKKGTERARSKRPDLKLLALVHALRRLSGDKGADITESNAQGLAEAAGSSATSSGRDLRRHYTRYTMGKEHHAQRLDDGKPYTVKARYLEAIAMLEEHPKALAMAEAELEELRERE